MNSMRLYRSFALVACFALLAHAVLLDDFEGGTSVNLLGGAWSGYADRDDGGNSTIVNGTLQSGSENIFTVLPADGEGVTGKGWVLHYKYGSVNPQRDNKEWGSTVGSQATLSGDSGGGRDLSDASHVSFWAKGSDKYFIVRFMLVTTDVKDYGYYRYILHLDTVWSKYTIALTDLEQPEWAVAKKFDPVIATRLVWELCHDDTIIYNAGSFRNPTEGKMWLDDVVLVGYYPTVTQLVNDIPPSTTDSTPTFKWHPVDEAASYEIQIVSMPSAVAAPDFTNPTQKKVLNDTVFTPSAALPSGIIHFRVKSDRSRWSDTCSFLLAYQCQPQTIQVESPTTVRKPVFTWHPPQQTASSYTLEVATRSDFKYPLISEVTADTFHVPADDLPLGVIYWRVRAESCAFSPASLLYIVDGGIPSLVPVESPTFNRRPTLRWKKPPSVPASYQLQISTDNTFTTAGIVVDTMVTDTFHTCSADLPFATFYWRVKGSDWSAAGVFQVADNRIPVLVNYDNPTFNRTPILSWNKPPVTVANYTVQISSGTVFSPLTMLVDTQVADTFYACTKSLPVGTVYWRVKAEDSQYSAVSSFTIRDSRVPIIMAYMPKITLVTEPVLAWHKVDGAASYNFELTNTPSFTGTVISVPVADTFYSVSVPLSFGTYYWRVRSDLVETWSCSDTFTIVNDSTPFILRFNGATVDGGKPIFVWNKVPGAVSYNFMLANNVSFSNAAISTPLADTSYTPAVNLASGKWYWKVSSDRDSAGFCMVDSFIVVATPAALTPRVAGMHRQAGVTAYDITGRLLATAIMDLPYGTTFLSWNRFGRHGRSYPPGMYIIRIVTSDGVTVQRIMKQR